MATRLDTIVLFAQRLTLDVRNWELVFRLGQLARQRFHLRHGQAHTMHEELYNVTYPPTVNSNRPVDENSGSERLRS